MEAGPLSQPLSGTQTRGRLALVTAHRRESFGEGLRLIFQAVLALTERVPDLRVLFPVHPNPQVRETAQQALGGQPRIQLTAPLDYPAFVSALLAADLVLTDSGGVQEEAVALGKPLLVLRDTTERREGIELGVAALVGTEVRRIVPEAHAILARQQSLPVPAANPYGDGRACARILEVLKTGRLPCPFMPGRAA